MVSVSVSIALLQASLTARRGPAGLLSLDIAERPSLVRDIIKKSSLWAIPRVHLGSIRVSQVDSVLTPSQTEKANSPGWPCYHARNAVRGNAFEPRCVYRTVNVA